jgi:hypothetical protein
VLELAIPSLLPPGAPYAWTATAEIAAGDELAGIAHAASGPHATGLTLADGRRLGLAVTLTEPSRAASGEFSGSWASFFEPYRYHDLELAAEAATLAAAPDQSVRRLEFRSAVPNPTPGATEFQFVVPGGAADAASATELTVFDVNGRLTRTLVARALSPGSHEVRWDGRDSRGADVPAGVYYVRLAAGKDVVTRKLTIVR